MVAIRAEHVSKRFRSRTVTPYTTLKTALVERSLGQRRSQAEPVFQALADVTLAVEEGRTLGVIGRNGSGKSTLLKILARILRPDRGEVRVNGKVAALLELGAGFHPEFTGRENVFINGIMLGLSKREVARRFDDIVRFAELESFIDDPVRTYSSGMYTRLGFAVAVHTDPDVLLIDEVLAVGDEAFKEKCYGKITEFQRRGKTIILVSHDLRSVAEWCHEAIWLDEGTVRARGTPGDVIGLYLEAVSRRTSETVAEPGAGERAARPEASPPAAPDPVAPAASAAGDAGTVEGRPGSGPRRWGSREVEIAAVRLLDRSGGECSSYETGEPMIVEVSYVVHRPPDEAVFGIAIVRDDGFVCYGTNTDIEGLPVPPLGTEGVVEVALESLSLVEGRYFLDVAVHPRLTGYYDYHSRLYPFSITSKLADVGVLRVPHRWHFRPRAA